MSGYVDKIMDYKLLGEDYVRSKCPHYAIVRPGVLMSSASLLPSALEINQGDTIGGGITRDELARVAVAACQFSDQCTFEVFRRNSRIKLQPEFPAISGKEHYGDSFEDLLSGITKDS